MEQPWEALDVDDSDLRSLLRPCKRLHRNPNSSTSPSQNPEPSQSQNSHQSPPQQRLIPGPAGAVQSAILRRNHDRQSHCFMTSQGDHPIPTQEYIRRAVDDSSDFDYDFQSNPWLCALEFLGVVNGEMPCTPLSSVNKCLNSSKVDQIVVVVKSCTPTGLGGLMVTLKDPTGSTGAFIHHKVLSESQYGKDICIGSVLVLQKVTVFCPSSSAYYLNITLGNLAKVFCKESGPPSVNRPAAAYKANYSDPEIAASTSAEKASALQKISNPVIDDRTTDRMSAGGSLHETQMEKENVVPNINNSIAFKKTSRPGKGWFNQIQNAAKGFEGTTGNRGNLHGNNNQELEENFQGSLSPRNKQVDSIKNKRNPYIQITQVTDDDRQPTASKASLLQWTDDQLDLLFACEDDDE